MAYDLTVLRISFLQQWFNRSDPAVEEALYESRPPGRRGMRASGSAGTCRNSKRSASGGNKLPLLNGHPWSWLTLRIGGPRLTFHTMRIAMRKRFDSATFAK